MNLRRLITEHRAVGSALLRRTLNPNGLQVGVLPPAFPRGLPFNHLRIIPYPTQNAVGQIDFASKTDANVVALGAPDVVAADILFRLPAVDGSAGDLLKTDGAKSLSFVAAPVGTVTHTAGALTANKAVVGNGTGDIKIATAAASGGAVATTAATNVSPFGYTTGAQADAIITLLNNIRAALVANGIMS